VEPWLPKAERRAARLPAVDPTCPPRQSPPAAPLSIVGIRPADQLRRPAASGEPLRLRVSALGGDGQRWWFLNGGQVGETAGQEELMVALTRVGSFELSVLDDSGQTARVAFEVRE
jgi:penicillin-binding protein 1C